MRGKRHRILQMTSLYKTQYLIGWVMSCRHHTSDRGNHLCVAMRPSVYAVLVLHCAPELFGTTKNLTDLIFTSIHANTDDMTIKCSEFVNDFTRCRIEFNNTRQVAIDRCLELNNYLNEYMLTQVFNVQNGTRFEVEYTCCNTPHRKMQYNPGSSSDWHWCIDGS